MPLCSSVLHCGNIALGGKGGQEVLKWCAVCAQLDDTEQLLLMMMMRSDDNIKIIRIFITSWKDRL